VKACAITFFALVMKFALITFDTDLREGIILGLHILNVRPVETKHPHNRFAQIFNNQFTIFNEY